MIVSPERLRDDEIFRYLGYSRSVRRDSETRGLVYRIKEKLCSEVYPKSVYRRLSVVLSGEQIIIGGSTGMAVKSDDLKRNLSGCTEAYLFAATLGLRADAAVKRYSAVSMAQAAVAQAVCSELIEIYCDLECEEIRHELAKEHLSIKPRFSPGYGDFSISYQKDFLRILELSGRLGIELNDEYLMRPTKSVTAVIGIT